MSIEEKQKIADAADMIVSGYSSNGDTIVQEKGRLNDHEINIIQKYIKKHYKEMYRRWSERSEKGFYEG